MSLLLERIEETLEIVKEVIVILSNLYTFNYTIPEYVDSIS